MKYVLVFGLILVSMAIVMLFLGNNAQAVVIVDQAGGGDYLTIQEGIDNAIPQETVEVWDGSYNENITIDKGVQLIGNGSATTALNASGLGNNAMNITAEGVEISGLAIIHDGDWYGIYCTAGDFYIHDNELTCQAGGIAIDLADIGRDLSGVAWVTVGDMVIDSNVITSVDYGISIDIQNIGYNLSDDAMVQFGAINITGNTISTNQGIVITRLASLGYDMSGNSSFTWGGFMISDNIINASGSGIYIEKLAWLGFLMRDNSSVVFGDFLLDGNTIWSGAHGLVLREFNYWGYDLSGNSTFTIGNLLFNNNKIDATGNGILQQPSPGNFFGYWGWSMNDASSYVMGDISFSSNTIDAGVRGFFLSQGRDWGVWMNDSSSYVMGNILFNDNIVNATNDGLYFNLLINIGSNMYHNSTCLIGDFSFIDNTINSGIDGIEFSNMFGFGFYMYDNSTFEMGDFNFIDNTINTNDNGIYFEPYGFGAFMAGNSSAIIGDNLISGNEINVVDGIGLYTWWWYSFAYEMYDNTTGVVGDSIIIYNIINVTGTGQYGIWTGPYECGQYLYGFSNAIYGDYIVNHNIIIVDNAYGIEFDFFHTGYEMYDNSNSTFGQFQINDNDINSTNGAGLFVNFDSLAYNVYDNTYFSMNELMIANNVITAQTAGIDITYIDCGGLYITSIAYLPGIQVLGNWVDPTISAFIYTTATTPFNNDPGATQVWGDVILDGNDFDAGVFGAVFDWQNPDPNVAQPVFYIRNTNIHDGPAGSTGLLLINLDDAYGDMVTIDGFDLGLNVDNSIVHYMFNSSIANCALLDISLFTASYLFMVNSTFDNTSVYFDDVNSLLEVGWYMNVLVQSQVALPVPDAIVAVADVDGTEIFNSTTNADGGAFFIICREYQEDITGIIKNFNDYTANATKSGAFGVAAPNPTMNQTRLVIITLTDNIPPDIFSDNSDTNGTTGDPFYFEINATDNLGIVSVHVNYRFGGVGPYTNLTLSGTGPYWLIEILPPDYVGFIEYYFSAADSGGLWVNTTPTTAPITDNDAPTYAWMAQPTVGTTGESVPVSILATDNVGVTYYKIDVDGTLYDLVKDGDYCNFTINIPPDSIADIIYSIILNDSADNPNTISGTTITVTDDDEPTYTWILQPTIGSAGDSVPVSLMATDNIGITNYTINVNGTVYDMTKDGDYCNYTINIPIGSTENFTYSITFRDGEGNSNTTIDTMVTLVTQDIEPPTYIWTSQPTAGTTGESVLVSLMATDNIGITYHKIDIDGTLYDLIKDGDYYNLTIDIPLNSTTDITYSVFFNDSANNPNGSLPTVITVTDNDAPTYNWVIHPISANTGDLVVVSLQAFDNIGVTSYRINIDGTLYDLTKDGNYYNYTIDVPSDSTASITYNITFTDAASNQVTTPDTTITVTALDSESPTYTWILYPETGTTGDPVEISLMATDNVGITTYQINIDGSVHDLVKDGNYYNYTFIISSDSTADMTYFIILNDAANNLNTLPDTTITVTDNDAPSNLVDSSDTTAATGDAFFFEVDATDNIGIHEVHAVYWFGDGTPTNGTMTGTGPFNFDITIPSDSLDTLHYYFAITDAAGNWLVGTQVDISITDNEFPSVSNAASDVSGRVGKAFRFQTDASDNVGISQVRVAYWFGDDESQKQFITLTATDGTYSGSFTPVQSGTMNYYFEVTDAGGNIFESDDYSVNIASAPEEEEEGLNPLVIILPVIVVIILLLLFLLMRKKKEEEVLPEVAEGEELEEEGLEPEEGFEEGEEVEGYEEGEDEWDETEEDTTGSFENDEGAEDDEGEEEGGEELEMEEEPSEEVEPEEEPEEETEPEDTEDEKPEEGDSEEQSEDKTEKDESDELDEILKGL